VTAVSPNLRFSQISHRRRTFLHRSVVRFLLTSTLFEGHHHVEVSPFEARLPLRSPRQLFNS